MRDVIPKTAAVAGKPRRALDSTILDDAVAPQNTVTQLTAQICRVTPRGPRRRPGRGRTAGSWLPQPGRPDIAQEDQAARDELVSRLVADANTVLAALEGVLLDERQQDASRCARRSPVKTWSRRTSSTALTCGGGSPASPPRIG
ncbi:hypothetical protein NQ152_16025 [Microbacterium sp. zg.B48]|uniref:hypothetical protein n=1 Tax=Microbacterium sp. zg.B48 TaxID=2969408 RepID=UPI00214C33BE|nr:hypothetical protein [Microbacterium sp. zg.B48]MCR2765014.1 hypothetical protein [Microbacterium sp. zg.B48]